MYYAKIKNQDLLAEYRFGSNTFKWVYYSSVKFARKLLYLHPEISVLTIEIEDIVIAVCRSGLTLDTPNGVYDIDKVDLWSDCSAYC